MSEYVVTDSVFSFMICCHGLTVDLWSSYTCSAIDTHLQDYLLSVPFDSLYKEDTLSYFIRRWSIGTSSQASTTPILAKMSNMLQSASIMKGKKRSTSTVSFDDLVRIHLSSEPETSSEDSGTSFVDMETVPVNNKNTTKRKASAPTADIFVKSKQLKLGPTSETCSDISLQSQNFVEPNLRQKDPGPTVKAQLFDLIKKYRVQNFLHCRDLMRTPGHELRSFSSKIILKKNFSSMIEECCAAAAVLEAPLTYRQRLRELHGMKYTPEVLQYAHNFFELVANQIDFSGNRCDPVVKWNNILITMSREDGSPSKVKTVYLTGVASGGKSSIMTLLSSMYADHEIGTFGPQAINSQFWFDNLYGKEIYLGDEVYATGVNINNLLMLMEGNSNLQTEIKYGGKVKIRPKPVVIGCNNHLFINCQAFADAVLARVVHIHFIRRCPPNLNIRPPKELLPAVLHCVFYHANKGRWPELYLPEQDKIEPDGTPIMVNMPAGYQDFDLD